MCFVILTYATKLKTIMFNRVNSIAMKTKLVISLLFLSMLTNAQIGYQVYFGNLHSHTSYSDGEQTPLDAYVYAKDVAGLDFLAVTDHMEQLSSSEFTQMQSMSQLSTINGTFIGIAGYEWGSPYYGHVNVFNATEMPSVLTYTDWSGFRDWLMDRPTAFAEFNHPGDESYFNNWYDFEYKGEQTDSSFALIEFQNIQQADDWYELSLNNGWHLSPAWNQDNHSADWGTKNDGRAGLWCTDLSLNSIYDAIRAGRTFATMDKNAYVWFETNNNPMGSRCTRYANMPFTIKLSDDDNEAWTSIEVRSSNGLIMQLSATGNFDNTINLSLYTDSYVYIRAIQADGDYVWSSPIYLEGVMSQLNENTSQTSFSIFPNPANDKIWITNTANATSPIYINVFSSTGVSLKSEVISSQLSNIFSLSTSHLESGMYFIEIEHENKKQVQKIIVH